MPLVDDSDGIYGDEAREDNCLSRRAMEYIRSTISLAGASLSNPVNRPEEDIDDDSDQGTTEEEIERETDNPGKIWHYELFVTDGYINRLSGQWPPNGDNTSIPGWNEPVYIWGFTDIDPDIPGNRPSVPNGAVAPAGSPVGNAKFPGPILQAVEGDDLFITVHNRGLFQCNQEIQDDQSLHVHGIKIATPHDGFPETAGGYGENLRCFWLEEWYLARGASTKERDDWWNSLTASEQQSFLRENEPIIKPNQLNHTGGIYSLRNKAQYPEGVGGKLPYGAAEDWAQFTYRIMPQRPGTFMYYCSLGAPEHIQMGMYGALIIRPKDGSKTVYGVGSNTGFDLEYTFILSEFDARWHRFIEGDPGIPNFYPADWKPDLWFINGRSFPQTLLPFAWNGPGGSEAQPAYNSHISAGPGQKVLIRYINAGYQSHPIHQHGWHMRIVGSDGFAWKVQMNKSTIAISSGESYEVITAEDGWNEKSISAALELVSPAPAPVGAGTLNWRQVYPIYDHNSYRTTTSGIYPGGMLTLMEIKGLSNANKPTWSDPYSEEVEPLP